MKKLLILIVTIGLLTACKNDDETPDPGNYQTPLPEATQSGKRIFACYVDGNAYIAEKHQITAYYQYIQGYYAFIVAGSKQEKPLYNISNGFSSNGLIENTTYILKNREKGNPWGDIFCI